MSKVHQVLAGGAVLAAIVAAGCGPLEQDEIATDATGLAAPVVQFVVYDGTTLPATVIAGCSEPTCLGAADGSDPTPGTGFVTHLKNNVGWMVAGDMKGSVYLYADGRKVASARSGRLMVWTAPLGTHTLQTVAYNSEGVAGWSPALTITAR